MTFSLRFQDPASDAANLLELLLESVSTAERGAGVFSFSSAHGIRLLLSDDDFAAFLERSAFELVVGIDAVTVPEALNLLHTAQAAYGGFRARAFLNPRPASLFHPKLCWFASATTGRVLVGSANLTRGGLLNNWEALGDATVRGAALANVEATWDAWIQQNLTNLRELDDDQVVTRARRNEGERRRRHEEDEVEFTDTHLRITPAEDDVLIAEIPRGNNRWNQANFNRDNFVTFFGLQPGVPRRVVLFPILPNGTVGNPEVRPSVDVRSRNFRIELGLAAGHGYPTAGRPIGVFFRLGTRRFQYRLLMPGLEHYGAVSQFLNNRTRPLPNRVRRLRLPSHEFRQHLPNVILQ